MQTSVIYGLLIPFVGTSLGSACVFFLKKGLGDRVQRGLTGFASGVMVAASIWSLLIPAMDQSAGAGTWAFLPAVIGFWVGILFLLGLDHLIPHLHQKSSRAEGPHTQLRRSTMASMTSLTARPMTSFMRVWSMRAIWPETVKSP